MTSEEYITVRTQNVFEMAVRDEMAYDISLDFLTEYIKRHKVQYSVTRLKDYYVVIVYR